MKIRNISPEKCLRRWWNLLWVRPGDVVYIHGKGSPRPCLVKKCTETACLHCALCNSFLMWTDCSGNAVRTKIPGEYHLLSQMKECEKWNAGRDLAFVPLEEAVE